MSVNIFSSGNTCIVMKILGKFDRNEASSWMQENAHAFEKSFGHPSYKFCLGSVKHCG